jgi:hypothetical protein
VADNRYTAKIRAKRIELEYFKRLHPFRRWKLMLSIIIPLIAGIWLVAYAARGDQRIYTSGPLSTAHAMWETACTDCHKAVAPDGKPNDKAFLIPVHDTTCLACHDGPIHAANQVDPHGKNGPTCASCHVEHKGHTQLADLADNTCTQCHADVKTKDGKPPVFAAKVSHFTSNHPEFAIDVKDDKGVVRRVGLDKGAEAKDTAAIKLNHEKHLKAGLKGIEDVQKVRGKDAAGIVQAEGKLGLSCAFCHVPDKDRRYIQPISYAKHCADCHPLGVGTVDATAPHQNPQIVHSFLRTLFIETHESCLPTAPTDPKVKEQCDNLGLAAAAPAEGGRGRRGGSGGTEEAPSEGPRLRRGGASLRPEIPPGVVLAQARGGRRGGEEAPPADAPKEEGASEGGGRGRGRFGRQEEAPATGGGGGGGGAGAAMAWASQQLTGAEKLMFKTCETCHVMKSEPNKLPVVAPTNIPTRWLPHSTFDHGAHRPVACAECHKVTASKETTDVLLPSVKLCRECHRPKDGARAGCVECHLYHDKTKERDPNGPFTVPQLVKRQPASAGSAGAR